MAVVLNIDRLLGKLDNLVDDQKIEASLEKACILVENEAKERCPVDDGQLRASITHEVSNGVGTIGTNVEYAPYVEYGTGLYASKGSGRRDKWSYQDAKGDWHTTRGQKPQPFLEPALLDNEEKIKDLLMNSIKEGIK